MKVEKLRKENIGEEPPCPCSEHIIEETQISSCITTGFFRAQKESREIWVAFVIGYGDGKPTTILIREAIKYV